MDYKNVTIHPSSGKKKGTADFSAAPGRHFSADAPQKKEKDSFFQQPTLHVTRPIPETDSISGTLQDFSAVMLPREGDKYRYRKLIGRGGMKLVLQVYDNDTMRDVAMAVLPDISTRSKLELGKFLREARITASLEHPNIVPVHDIGLDSAGSPYFTMKLLKGETLGTVLKKLSENDPVYQERYPLQQLMLIYMRICNAIAFAHSKGIVHLDLKPENVQLGDYGEVLVLDWGLARKVHDSPGGSAPEKISTKTRKIRKYTPGTEEADPAQKSQDCDLVDGTPGYMAPEQISGTGYSCSIRTDIYALGALLYAMITGKNPLCSTQLDEMLRDTLRGNILRPSERVPEREIPFGLEAVVLKAMHLNPEERYNSVNELRSEINSFIRGFDTKAEKASILKKSLLFIKRHKRAFISVTLILLLAAQLLWVYMREAKRGESLWLPVLTGDFQKPGYPVDLIQFTGSDFKEDPRGWANTVADDGLLLPSHQWLYLKESFPGNIKIQCTLDLPENPKGEVELLLLDSTGSKPVYVFHLDLQQSKVMEIFCADSFYAPRLLAYRKSDDLFRETLFSKYQPFLFKNKSKSSRKKLHLCAEYREGSLSLQVNHQEILAIHSDLLKKTNQITAAIHSGIPGTKLLNLKVHRLVPPENTLPLFLGETLLREKLYDKAIHSFLRIEENRRGTKVAREALIKAYQVAALHLEGEARSEITLEIKKRLAAFYPDFNPAILLEEDVCIAWKTKDYALAAVLLEKTFEYNPETLVMKKILALPHCPLSPDVGNLLLRMIRRSENIKSADLSNYGLRSLQALAGKELLALDCSGNRLHSLKGISGRQLQSLNCSGNRLVSLEEIQLPELRYLDCSSNNIKNFSALKNIPNLTRVNLSGNPRSVTEKTLQKLPLLRHKKY